MLRYMIALCGGPNNYTGRSMIDSHKHLKITELHF